jgi:hypothetical protein
MRAEVVAWVVGMVGVLGVERGARAGDAGEAKAPVPEPILAETVTDIDGTEAGEVELEANGSWLRARRGGAYAVDGSAEVEWLILRRLGLRLEPRLSRDGDGAPPEDAAGVSGGASWKLLQDFEHDLHVQAEVVGRYPTDSSPIVEPGDPARPLAFDVRGAFRRGIVTLRGSAGVGVLGPSEHVPLRGSLAGMFPFEESGRYGYWGVELDADGARDAPLVVALDLVPNFEPAGLPLLLGLALPWTVGEREDRPSLGLFFRVIYESSREIEFASPHARTSAWTSAGGR